MDLENETFDAARKTWNLGKQLGLFASNENEVIAALAKINDIKSGKCK